LARTITKKLHVSDRSLVHLTSILLLHYLVKCRSRSLAIYNNQFILGRACRLRKALWDHKIIENLLLIILTLVRRKSIIPRSQTSTNWNDALTVSGLLWVTRLLNVLLASGTNVYALALVLEADILSTRCNKDDVMW